MAFTLKINGTRHEVDVDTPLLWTWYVLGRKHDSESRRLLQIACVTNCRSQSVP
jgi:hypothetical protein